MRSLEKISLSSLKHVLSSRGRLQEVSSVCADKQTCRRRRNEDWMDRKKKKNEIFCSEAKKYL